MAWSVLVLAVLAPVIIPELQLNPHNDISIGMFTYIHGTLGVHGCYTENHRYMSAMPAEVCVRHCHAFLRVWSSRFDLKALQKIK